MTAGASAAAKATQLRHAARGSLWRRALHLLGLDRKGDAARTAAGNWDAGAEGERRTAALLQPLAAEGWYGLYDRALPGGGRANADAVLIPPCGTFVANVDSKLWSSRYRLHAGPDSRGLWHGTVDRSRSLDAVLHESRCITTVLGVRVVTVIAVHNAPVDGAGFVVRGVRVVPAGGLLTNLRRWAGPADPVRSGRLAGRSSGALRRYVD